MKQAAGSERITIERANECDVETLNETRM